MTDKNIMLHNINLVDTKIDVIFISVAFHQVHAKIDNDDRNMSYKSFLEIVKAVTAKISINIRILKNCLSVTKIKPIGNSIIGT